MSGPESSAMAAERRPGAESARALAEAAQGAVVVWFASSMTGADPTGIPLGAASCRTSVSSTASRRSMLSIRSSRLIRLALLLPSATVGPLSARSVSGTPSVPPA